MTFRQIIYHFYCLTQILNLVVYEVQYVWSHGIHCDTVDELEEIVFDDGLFFVVFHALIAHLQVMIVLQQVNQGARCDLYHLAVLEVNVVIVHAGIIFTVTHAEQDILYTEIPVEYRVGDFIVEEERHKRIQALGVTLEFTLQVFAVD